MREDEMILNTEKEINRHLKIKEITFEELESKLYHQMQDLKFINAFDFPSFDKVVRKWKRHLFSNEESFNLYKKDILSSTRNGSCDLPTFQITDEYWDLVEGRIRIFAYKVLGITPVVQMVF